MMSRSLLFDGYLIGTQELGSIADTFHSAWYTKEIPFILCIILSRCSFYLTKIYSLAVAPIPHVTINNW